MFKLIIALFTLVYSSLVYSGEATGRITTILVADNSYSILFKLSSEINATPRCNEGNRFSISLRKPGGIAAYTAILEAKKEGYEVNVTGLNTCTNEWNSEDTKNIVLN